jgi:hypothetical protein
VAAEKVLIAASPRLGGALLAAARSAGLPAEWLDLDAARDPTLDIPEAVIATAATWVLLVDPRREEPATLDVVRGLGARSVVWLLSLDSSAARSTLARRRWVSRAADAVAVIAESRFPRVHDRFGRPAAVVPLPAEGDARPAIDSLRALQRRIDSASRGG